jgi:predicted metal-dependent phosphoesterase TrpH
MHTRSSDGGWTPSELIDYLAERRFAVVAVCDHDTMRSVPETIERGSERGIIVIPGVEFTTWWSERQWHLLVYGIDPASPSAARFNTLLRRQQDNLAAAAERAISLLEQSGHKLPSLENVVDGRPLLPVHVLLTAIKDGHATNLSTAHELTKKYGEDLRVDTPLEDVVEAARSAGAITVVAHPGRDDGAGIMSEEQFERMVAEIPIDGLEGHYRSHSDADTTRYRSLAEGRGLLISSGSDSHAPSVPVNPRPYPARWVVPFLERLGFEAEPFEGEAWRPGASLAGPLDDKPAAPSEPKPAEESVAEPAQVSR